MNEDIKKLAEQPELRLIPEKSKVAYYKEYDRLVKWMPRKNSDIVDMNTNFLILYSQVNINRHHFGVFTQNYRQC